jgi:hypothetical protein
MSVLFNSGRLLARQLIFFAPACICSFALKIWLVPEIGPAGVVWASVIAFSAIYVIPAWFMASRHLHNGIKQAGVD